MKTSFWQVLLHFSPLRARFFEVFSVLIGWLFYRWGMLHWFSAVILFTPALLLCLMAWIRWYDRRRPRAGIEDHFDKTHAAALWLTPLGLLSVAVLKTAIWLYAFAAVLLFFVFFNLSLIVFHFRDSDPMEPNALSGETRVF